MTNTNRTKSKRTTRRVVRSTDWLAAVRRYEQDFDATFKGEMPAMLAIHLQAVRDHLRAAKNYAYVTGC